MPAPLAAPRASFGETGERGVVAEQQWHVSVGGQVRRQRRQIDIRPAAGGELHQARVAHRACHGDRHGPDPARLAQLHRRDRLAHFRQQVLLSLAVIAGLRHHVRSAVDASERQSPVSRTQFGREYQRAVRMGAEHRRRPASASGGCGRLVEQPNPAQPGDQIGRPTAADAEPLGGDGSGDPRLGPHQPDDLGSTEPPLLRRRPLLLGHRHDSIHLIKLIV